jgi:hypothetical protein
MTEQLICHAISPPEVRRAEISVHFHHKLSTTSTCISGSMLRYFPFIFSSNSSSKVANYQRCLIPVILTIYSHDYCWCNITRARGVLEAVSVTNESEQCDEQKVSARERYVFVHVFYFCASGCWGQVLSFFWAGKVCFVFLCSEKNCLWTLSQAKLGQHTTTMYYVLYEGESDNQYFLSYVVVRSLLIL